MTQKTQGLLWSVSHPDRPGLSSRLFGTMHIRDGRAFSDIARVYEHIQGCEVFAAEFDLGDLDNLSASPFRLAPTAPLDALMGPRHYQRLRKILARALHLSLDQFRHAHPLVTASVVTEQLQQRDAPLALDHHLYEYAASEGKQLIGIETLAEQAEIMAQIPLAYHVDQLVAMSRHFSKYARKMRQLAEVYESGDLRRLHQLTRRGDKKMRRVLVEHRNKVMVDRLLPWIDAQSLFFAVGAGHLPGRYGLIHLLRQEGYVVRCVRE